VGAVAFSRLYLDRHWLSDLGGGFSIGLAYLLLAIWLIEVVLVRAPSAQTDATGEPIGDPIGDPTPRDSERV
jgi:hypothetical protein